MKNLKFALMLIIVFFVATPLIKVSAAEYDVQTITLSFNASKHFKFRHDILRVVAGSDDIIRIKQLPPAKNEFIISAREHAGTTTLFVWTVDSDEPHEYIINVEDSGLSEIIERMINLPDVHVKKVGERILLSGTVKNQYERNYAIQAVRLYLGNTTGASLNTGSTTSLEINTQTSDSRSGGTIGSNSEQDSSNIIDLLHVLNPTKIRFEAQIVEITSDNTKDLGIQYGVAGSDGVFYFGENYGSDNAPRFNSRPLKWVEQRFGSINATINALVTKGKARILSRPNITTLDGEDAAIQVGGEIPYTTINYNGYVTTQFKDYGIILQLKPVVDAEGRITSAIHTEVSNMSGETVNGYPIINTRRADTVMTMASGSTMIIGGLIDSTEAKNISKIPLLGDIPIIGEFFKYTSKRKEKRELIILVTPHIVSDYDTRRANMSDDMRDYYNEQQREQDSLNDVDLNATPPLPEVFEEPKANSKFKNPNKK